MPIEMNVALLIVYLIGAGIYGWLYYHLNVDTSVKTCVRKGLSWPILVMAELIGGL